MQSPRGPTLESILDRVERRENRARSRALLYTIVPIVMASILLVYTSVRIQRETRQIEALQQVAAQYNQQVEFLKDQENQYKAQIDDLKNQSNQYASEVQNLKNQVDSLRNELEDSEERLRNAVELSQYTHPVDFVDLKSIYSRNPRAARILDQILSLRERNVGWRLGGQTPEQGFDSPSFAMFILHSLELSTNLIRPGESLLEASRLLFRRLRDIPSTRPRVGDLVFYPAGYVLFYFKDQRDRPFVIGMTPMGITALRPDFANPIGYRQSGL